MKKLAVLILVSLFALGAEDEAALRAKLTQKVLSKIKESACKKDEAGVLNYFFYKRVNWSFDVSDAELVALIEKKYAREANQLDADQESKKMRSIWSKFFQDIKADVRKGSDGNLCSLSVQQVKQIPNNRAVEATIKFKDGRTDTWYIAEGRAAFDKNSPGPEMIVDQDSKVREEMKKNFPTVFFAADNSFDPQNP